jgi:hypothetical protein
LRGVLVCVPHMHSASVRHYASVRNCAWQCLRCMLPMRHARVAQSTRARRRRGGTARRRLRSVSRTRAAGRPAAKASSLCSAHVGSAAQPCGARRGIDAGEDNRVLEVVQLVPQIRLFFVKYVVHRWMEDGDRWRGCNARAIYARKPEERGQGDRRYRRPRRPSGQNCSGGEALAYTPTYARAGLFRFSVSGWRH